MLRFGAPYALALLVPALGAAWALARRRRLADARLPLPGASLRLRLGRTPWQHLERAIPVLRGLTLVLIAAALARPQAGEEIRTVSTFGVDIVLALDVSTSMMAEDFPGNRLEEARRTVKRFVSGRPEDRLGLVLFAGLAVTRCPLTADHEMLRQFLDEVDFAPRDQDGTAIGMGLAAAVNRLRDSDAKSKVVVLLTDGRNNRGQIGPETAVEAAAALGVRVYTIGVGTEGEAPVPVDVGPLGRRMVMQRVDVDEPLLRKIAERTDGRYFRATDADTLAQVFTTIDTLEKSEIKSRVRTLYTELFTYLLVPAVALLVVERALNATRLRRIP